MDRWFLKCKLISYNKRTLARPTTDERMNGDGEPATGNNTLSAFSASSLWNYDRTARQYWRQPAKKHPTTEDKCSQTSLKCSEKKMNNEPIKFSCKVISNHPILWLCDIRDQRKKYDFSSSFESIRKGL